MEALLVLPGVGRKTAQRLAYYLLKCPGEEVDRLTEAIQTVRERLHPCSVCGYLDESDPCTLCSDPEREPSVICVVEDSLNVDIIERSGVYSGLYHVLGGVISPLHGMGPEQLNVESLAHRVVSGAVSEVILATNPTVEGMVTSRYIEKLLDRKNLKITELARGLSVGSDLEFADEITVAMAVEGRREIR